MKRNIYLKTIPPAEAVARVKASIDREALIREETIPSHEASGRVLAHAVHARYSSPTFHSAAMDGYAVNARSTFAAREGHPLTLKAGETCFAVNTGHPMPEGCDAVIMIEQVVLDGGSVTIEAPAFPWQHVRRIGEDIVATELLFPRNHQLRPWDVGALLSGGIWDVPVWERVTVRIIPTGDEVLDFTTHPDPGKGQVVESNSQMLAALARELGCVVERAAPVPDNPEALHQALKDSLDAGRHLTIFCAGSSAGSKDFTRATLEKEGEILTHGIKFYYDGAIRMEQHCYGEAATFVFGVWAEGMDADGTLHWALPDRRKSYYDEDYLPRKLDRVDEAGNLYFDGSPFPWKLADDFDEDKRWGYPKWKVLLGKLTGKGRKCD